MKRLFFQAFAGVIAICSVSSAALLIPVAVSGGRAKSGIPSLDAFGRSLTFELKLTTDPSERNFGYPASTNGGLNYGKALGVPSVSSVIWGGGGTNSNIIPNEFAPVDFTQAGIDNSIQFLTRGDNAVAFSIILSSGAGNTATWMYVIPPSEKFTEVILALGAQSSSTGVFNMNAVTAARFVVGIEETGHSNNFPYLVGPVTPTEEVPEPISIAFVGLGLVGLGVISRKNRQFKSK